MTDQIKQAINESVLSVLKENKDVQRTVLENRVKLIEEMIALDELGFLDKAKNYLRNKAWGAEKSAKDWFGKNVLVNPSDVVGDPQQVGGLLDKTIASAKKDVMAFKADALRSSEHINKLQNSVFDLFGKFYNLLDEMPPESRGRYEREVMQIVGMFYNALMEEKKRIEVYISALAREAGTQGYDLGQSARALAAYRPEERPRVVGSRVVEPSTSGSPSIARGFKASGA